MNLGRAKNGELNEYEAAAMRLQARMGDRFSGEDIAWEVRRSRWESQFQEVLAGARRPPEHPDKIRCVDIKRLCGLLGDDKEYVRDLMIREYKAWLEFARRHARHMLPAETTARTRPTAPIEPSNVVWFK